MPSLCGLKSHAYQLNEPKYITIEYEHAAKD